MFFDGRSESAQHGATATPSYSQASTCFADGAIYSVISGNSWAGRPWPTLTSRSAPSVSCTSPRTCCTVVHVTCEPAHVACRLAWSALPPLPSISTVWCGWTPSDACRGSCRFLTPSPHPAVRLAVGGNSLAPSALPSLGRGMQSSWGASMANAMGRLRRHCPRALQRPWHFEARFHTGRCRRCQSPVVAVALAHTMPGMFITVDTCAVCLATGPTSRRT